MAETKKDALVVFNAFVEIASHLSNRRRPRCSRPKRRTDPSSRMSSRSSPSLTRGENAHTSPLRR